MTKITILRRACKAWPHHELATRQQITHLRSEYARKLIYLGDRYLLARANYVQKREAA